MTETDFNSVACKRSDISFTFTSFVHRHYNRKKDVNRKLQRQDLQSCLCFSSFSIGNSGPSQSAISTVQ